MQSGTANDEHYGLAEGIDAAASSPRPHSEAFPKRHLTPLIGFRERHTTATHGEDAMLTVFDNAPPERIVGATVNQTIAAVLPPTQTTTEPKPPANEDDEDDDEPEDLSKEVVKLRDHVERLGEALDEIRLAESADPITIQRLYKHFLEDAKNLGPVPRRGAT